MDGVGTDWKCLERCRERKGIGLTESHKERVGSEKKGREGRRSSGEGGREAGRDSGRVRHGGKTKTRGCEKQ